MEFDLEKEAVKWCETYACGCEEGCDRCAEFFEIAAYKAGFTKAKELYQPKWISVEDALPEKNEHVLLFNTGLFGSKSFTVTGIRLDNRWNGATDWTSDWDSSMELNITHWMPLPNKPEAKV